VGGGGGGGGWRGGVGGLGGGWGGGGGGGWGGGGGGGEGGGGGGGGEGGVGVCGLVCVCWWGEGGGGGGGGTSPQHIPYLPSTRSFSTNPVPVPRKQKLRGINPSLSSKKLPDRTNSAHSGKEDQYGEIKKKNGGKEKKKGVRRRESALHPLPVKDYDLCRTLVTSVVKEGHRSRISEGVETTMRRDCYPWEQKVSFL